MLIDEGRNCRRDGHRRRIETLSRKGEPQMPRAQGGAPPGYYTVKEAAKLLGFSGQTWSETIRENPCAAIAAALKYGIDISGNRVYFPKDRVDSEAKRLGRKDPTPCPPPCQTRLKQEKEAA